MDPIGKLRVIHALEDGRPKADIAREFGINSRTINAIYQQKDFIIKKHAQKYRALKVQNLNLDKTLLNWLLEQIKNGGDLKEPQLRNKAQELISNRSNENLNCKDDWLRDFQKRHNIIQFTSKIDCSPKDEAEWRTFIEGVEVNDVYITGMCGLFHSYSFDDFVNQREPKDNLSLLFIVNCLGSDKQQLVVAGRGEISEECVRSLPVNYFQGEKPFINYNIIYNILKYLDESLKLQNRSIYLFVAEDMINRMQFENIKLLNLQKMVYVKKCVQKIVESFKYHYRRSLMTRKLVNNQCTSSLECLDYLHMTSASWQAMSPSFFNMLFFPPEEGSLYLDTDDSSNTWLTILCNQLGYDCKENLIERYVFSDNQLNPLSDEQNDIQNVNEELLKNSYAVPSSSIQAFQAMKRLFSYLQSENGRDNVMHAARKLEDHLENAALVELHSVYASINDTE